MKRILSLVAGFIALTALTPAAASAQIVTLGQTQTPIVAPTCPKGVAPGSCYIVLTRTTAVQAASDGVLNPMKVTQPGWIVALTVGLSRLSSDPHTERGYIHGLDVKYGGTPQVALSVLQPGPRNTYAVVSQSAMFHVIPFLGQVLQEPLSLPPTFTTMTPLSVKPGEVVGLTIPTWAPVLAYNLPASKFSYRQSRRANCTHAPATETAQTTVGASTQYRCTYTGTRVEYSVTEVVDQPYPKRYVGGPS